MNVLALFVIDRTRSAIRARRRYMAGPARVAIATAALAIAACTKDSTSPNTNGDCNSGNPIGGAVGSVTSPLSGTAVCAAGGSSGAEYVLIPFNSSTSAAKISFDVEATGTTTPAPVTFSLVPGGGTATSAMLAGPVGRRDAAFEARLRAREAALTPLIAGARRRAALRTRSAGASFDVIPSTITVGQRLTLNTNADDACGNPVYKVGRVVAVSSKSVVVADTTNPINGFTDDDYRAIGATFDNVIDPLMTANFGAPADIDSNGQILLFFTRSVNELTPADNNGAYVGGFFFGRDLFPTTGTATLPGCESSNVGELFYLLVPDPTGTINGNEFSRDDVREIAVSIVAHEYQHLINASRRIYVSTTAEDFEEGWLNEGLSHIAEELLFYRDSGKLPRQDLDPTSIRSSAAAVDAFNSHQSSNFGRYRLFLQNPSTSSPYADNDSLATRGATWSFLRYALDRQNASDATLLFRLVNNGKVGIKNIAEVFGADTTTLFRDWATSVFADNAPGVAARYQQPSWNFRSIYKELYGSFPLKTVSLAAGTPSPVSLVGGGAAYLRFAVPAGSTGRVSWGTVATSVQMTLLRTK